MLQTYVLQIEHYGDVHAIDDWNMRDGQYARGGPALQCAVSVALLLPFLLQVSIFFRHFVF
ncbi:hypothetical protein HYW11_03865 [Candidatus Peregrinibacteria bacterium]|nr:hypothetical protein [Candidatus Peregrinibacteria bacterium]